MKKVMHLLLFVQKEVPICSSCHKDKTTLVLSHAQRKRLTLDNFSKRKDSILVARIKSLCLNQIYIGKVEKIKKSLDIERSRLLSHSDEYFQLLLQKNIDYYCIYFWNKFQSIIILKNSDKLHVIILTNILNIILTINGL
jgi:hypothetical protein